MKKLVTGLFLAGLLMCGSISYAQSSTATTTTTGLNSLSSVQVKIILKQSLDHFYPIYGISYDDFWTEYCCGNVTVTHLGKNYYSVSYGGTGVLILVEDNF